jgi:hypothetical protein
MGWPILVSNIVSERMSLNVKRWYYCVDCAPRARQLLSHVMRLPKQPAVLFVNAFWWCRDPDGGEGHKTREAGQCDEVLADPALYLPRLQRAGPTLEQDATSLAVQYDLSRCALPPPMIIAPQPLRQIHQTPIKC